MTSTLSQFEWNTVHERLARHQAQSTVSECVDCDRIVQVFRERARRLEQRGRHGTTALSQVPAVAFRLGKQRFGIRLTDLGQVFTRVRITPLPGACDLLLGVAHLNGALRSVVDLSAVVQASATSLEDGYIILLRANGRSLAAWVEAIDGVFAVDVAKLVAVDEAATAKTANLTLGITDTRIVILDTAAVIGHVKEQISTCEP